MKKISELFKDIVRCIAIGITISAIKSIAISIMWYAAERAALVK